MLCCKQSFQGEWAEYLSLSGINKLDSYAHGPVNSKELLCKSVAVNYLYHAYDGLFTPYANTIMRSDLGRRGAMDEKKG